MEVAPDNGRVDFAASEVQPADISGLRDQLREPREAIEAAFLEVGDRLSRSATLLDRIVGAFAALPRDLDGAEMTGAIARLGNFTRRTREIYEAFAVERTDIEKLVLAVDAATHPIGDLRRSVKMMGILAVNARIVAAGLNDAADQFDVFTTDIANLSDGAVRAIGAFSAGHARLASVVHGASEQFAEFGGTQRDVLAGLATGLETSLAELAERRRAACRSCSPSPPSDVSPSAPPLP